ncbi:hypothetical protein [Nocardioides convexus]|uniref:hypothetical protein n=1 Tax=Nocardioides convexus TaxID=2712224 RepID=UPI002418A7CA|nr:hypothetical protein [Nocardioides convexus]
MPTAIGSGAIGPHAASTSELAFDSRLARGVPLVPLHRQAEVLAGDRAAAVRLHPVLHDAGAQAARHDADRAQDRHAGEQPEHRPEQARADLPVAERRQHDVVGRPAQHPRVRHGQGTEEHTAHRREGEDQRLALDGHPQDAETRRRRTGAARRCQ